MSELLPNPEHYFREFLPQRDQLLHDLEHEAHIEGIPIVGPVVGELLFILARVTGAANLLELGTATGYSAIYLARGCEPAGGRVLTLEMDKAMVARAQGSLEEAELSQRVEVRPGDALQLMAAMEGPFDFIFMDLDKESYLPALPHCRRLLKPGGLLVTDNVAFTGASPFNQEIFASKDWRTVHLLSFLPNHSPEHDGLSLAVRVK